MPSKPIQLIVVCIALITLTTFILGAFLAVYGHEGASILFNAGTGGLGGMIALLSSTRPSTPQTENGATKVEVQNTPANPVNTQEATKDPAADWSREGAKEAKGKTNS